jgi:nucleotide-binding universal stress UspA family protein
MKPFRKILVPVDFSEHSARAVRTAAQLARSNDGSLDLLYVYDPVAYPLPEGYVLFTPEQLERLFAEIQQRLGEMKTLALAEGAPRVETHLRQGITDADICQLARTGSFDLIVMGTHGRRGLSHALLGSVAGRVLRAAPCPVLTVRAEPAERTTRPGKSEACCPRQA